jgi:GNAT superfamily N-acetyltransferase
LTLKLVRAGDDGVAVAASILREVSNWLASSGRELWDLDEISDADIAKRASIGELVLAFDNGSAVACMYLQDTDAPYWPEARDGEALYVHRLAVRRSHSGRGVSRAMLDWAVAEARRVGRPFVRLDTELRPALLTLYENAGFRRVDSGTIKVGMHDVVRFERVV